MKLDEKCTAEYRYAIFTKLNSAMSLNTDLFSASTHCPRIGRRVEGEDWFLCTAGWSLQDTWLKH